MKTKFVIRHDRSSTCLLHLTILKRDFKEVLGDDRLSMNFCRKQAHAPCCYSFTCVFSLTLASSTTLSQTAPFISNTVNVTVILTTEQIPESNLVNKTNLVHSLFLVYLSISTCFGRLWAHHQGKQLCFCDTCYLLFCVDDDLVCRVRTLHTRPSSTQNNKY